jgi:uncharacterized protein YjbJ (UPF0337 family)
VFKREQTTGFALISIAQQALCLPGASQCGCEKGKLMNWDQIEGKRKRFIGLIRERWGRFAHMNGQTIAGKKERLVGQAQERHGVAKSETEKRAGRWSRALKSSQD